MRQAMSYSKRRYGVDPLASWLDCIKVEQPEPVQQAEAASTLVKAKNKAQTRNGSERLRDAASLVFSPLTGPLQRRLAKIQSRIDAFLEEARQASYGFRAPDGIGRMRAFRQLIEGTPARTRIDQKGL